MDVSDIAAMTAALTPILVSNAQLVGQEFLDDVMHDGAGKTADATLNLLTQLARKVIARFKKSNDEKAILALRRLSQNASDEAAIGNLKQSTASLLASDHDLRSEAHRVLTSLQDSPISPTVVTNDNSVVGKVITIGNQTIAGDVTF